MSDKNIQRVLNNLSAETLDIFFTGGEPLSKKSTLISALTYLKQKRESILPKGKVHVQTNGFWIQNQKSAYETLSTLYDLGVNVLDIASFDKYHEEQGLDLPKLERDEHSPLEQALKKLINESGVGNPITIYTSSTANEGVIPIGRAKELPKEEYAPEMICVLPNHFKDNNKLVMIDPDGQTHLCVAKTIPPIGSALEIPIDELIDNARKDQILRILMKSGLAVAVQFMGTEFSSQEEFDQYRRNACINCTEAFKDYSLQL